MLCYARQESPASWFEAMGALGFGRAHACLLRVDLQKRVTQAFGLCVVILQERPEAQGITHHSSLSLSPSPHTFLMRQHAPPLTPSLDTFA